MLGIYNHCTFKNGGQSLRFPSTLPIHLSFCIRPFQWQGIIQGWSRSILYKIDLSVKFSGCVSCMKTLVKWSSESEVSILAHIPTRPEAKDSSVPAHYQAKSHACYTSLLHIAIKSTVACPLLHLPTLTDLSS